MHDIEWYERADHTGITEKLLVVGKWEEYDLFLFTVVKRKTGKDTEASWLQYIDKWHNKTRKQLDVILREGWILDDAP